MEANNQISELTPDELTAIWETCCEACKGSNYFRDSNCRFYCEAFAEAVKEHLTNL
jgi:hypothetical protein